MPPSRVVITGMGWVTPLGHDVDAAWARLLAGDSGVGPIARFDASTFSTNFAGEVRSFRLEDFGVDPDRHPGASLASQFALAAARNAWAQAGLDALTPAERADVGLYMGSGEGTPDTTGFFATHLAAWNPSARAMDYRAWAALGPRLLDPRREIEQEPNIGLAHLAEEFGCRGPSSNCMTACAASTQAIGEGAEIIRRGEAGVVLAGGAHSMIHVLGITGFIRLTAMSSRRDSPTTAARPFDRARDGFVMGEGAGMLVLESLDHARARGATPLAEVAGFGSSADAFRITDIQPEGKGAQAAMLQACRQAGVNPREPEPGDPAGRPAVHYISAHGTGTQENDRIETRAVRGVFGPMAPRIPFSSVKSMMGHLIQAAGAVELITCVQALRTGWVPPTMNLSDPDPECDLDYVPNVARDLRSVGGVRLCLSNSFGFGGQNDTVAVRRWEG